MVGKYLTLRLKALRIIRRRVAHRYDRTKRKWATARINSSVINAPYAMARLGYATAQKKDPNVMIEEWEKHVEKSDNEAK